MATVHKKIFFKPGRWNGEPYTREQIKQAAIAYNPVKSPAYVQFGHSENPDGKHGLVYRLEAEGDLLGAFIDDLSDDAKTADADGMQWSASFAKPNTPINGSNSLVLRHLALVPRGAVSDLPQTEVVNFEQQNEDLIMSDKDDKAAELAAISADIESQRLIFEAERKALADEKAAFEKEREYVESGRAKLEKDEVANFCQMLADKNAIHPAQKDKLAHALMPIRKAEPQVVNFSEGGELSQWDALKVVLGGLPTLDFAEKSAQTNEQKPEADETDGMLAKRREGMK